MNTLVTPQQQLTAQQQAQQQAQVQRTMEMLDMNDFPALGARTANVPATPPNLNMRSTLAGLAIGKGNARSDFSLQNEEFPALPSAIKAPRSQQEQAAEAALSLESPMSQGDRYGNFGPAQFGGGAGQFSRGAPGQKPVGAGYGPHLHEPLAGGFEAASLQLDVVAGAPRGVNATQGSGSDQYSLLGLLNVIRMTDQDMNTLALGIDLTTLGLSLNAPDTLYKTFASPWSANPARNLDPEFSLPNCYLMSPPLPPPLQKMSQFTDETLFYIFYAMPRDLLQQAAAAELYAREWRYHRELKLWFTRMPGTEPTQKTPTYERGTYIYFDVHSWQKVRKDFVLAYDQLEERKINPSM